MNKNVSDFARRYSESIQQLAGFNTQWVVEIVAEYLRSSAEAERLVSTVREDHAAVVEKRTVRDTAELQRACSR